MVSFAAYAHERARTEAEVWKRYHAAKGIADTWSERRRDMTWVEITGGLSGAGPARDDQLVIRHWNRDGVCEETVVAFDYDTGPAAASRYAEDDDPPDPTRAAPAPPLTDLVGIWPDMTDGLEPGEYLDKIRGGVDDEAG